MKEFIYLAVVLVLLSCNANAIPVVYTDENLFLADLQVLGFVPIEESFEDEIVWMDSRNSIIAPGRTPSVISQDIVWSSNYLQNEIATGNVGGDAPDGTYAIYSLPHGMTTDGPIACDDMEEPLEVCYQNDGLKIEHVAGRAVYAFGGRIDTANSGKVTFLLDGYDINGNDTDNIGNWQREGDFADNWDFVGVIDTDGFYTAELREIRGKDWQQVLLFCDDFTIGVLPVCTVDLSYFERLSSFWLRSGPDMPVDLSEDGIIDLADFEIFALQWLNDCPDTWPRK